MKLFSKTIFAILLTFLVLTLNAQIYPTKTSIRGAESTGSIVDKPLNNDVDATDSIIPYLSLTAPTPPVVTLKTDKDVYVLGENVTITLTNVGNETVQIGGYPAWQIFTYPGKEPVYPKIFAFLAWSLDPRENDTFTWNQYNKFTESFVNPGAYVIKDTQGWGLSAYFEISGPRIYITGIRPLEGPIGTKVLIVGEGATPNGMVIALLENFTSIVEIGMAEVVTIPVGETIADKEGHWDIWFEVPSFILPGEVVVRVVDSETQTSDWTTFFVTAAQIIIEYVSPQSGLVGTSVYVNGRGATPYGEVRVYFDKTNMANTTAKDGGWWSASFEVPDVDPGNYTIVALDVTTNTADRATFTVTPPPTIHVSPSEAPIGSKISITGKGFTPKQGIFITFEDLLLLSPIVTDENGEFNVTLFVPMVNSGNYTIKATTAYPYQVTMASVSFTVTLGTDTLFQEFANLKTRYEELNTEYNSLRSDLNSLNSTNNNQELNYTDLKSEYEALTADLVNARNLNYIFLVSIIICIAAIAYLAIRKPKAKP